MSTSVGNTMTKNELIQIIDEAVKDKRKRLVIGENNITKGMNPSLDKLIKG